MFDENDILHQLNTRVRRLKFTDAVEASFLNFYYKRFLTERRVALTLGLLVFLCSGVLDYLFIKESLEKVLLLRYFISAPVILLCAYVVVMERLSQYQQQALLAIVLTLGFTLVAIIGLASLEISLLYFTGIILVMIFGCCLCFMRYKYAALSVLIIGICYNAEMLLDERYTFSTLITHNYFYWGAGLLVLGCSYLLEASARATFLYETLLKEREKKLQIANEDLSDQATRDSLTGMANRRYFDDKLTAEWRRAARSHHPVSLVMLDIDFFKKFNDSYGHQQGDTCLQQVAKAIMEFAKRPGDLAARYGGEEFGLILGETGESEALHIAEDVVKSVKQLAIAHESSSVSDVVTISAGVASVIPEQNHTPEELIKLADQALYKAKSSGRNKATAS